MASSSPYHQENSTQEERSTSYRSQIISRDSIKTFNSSAIPLKPGGKSTAVIAIQENREREKRELSHLNDRFASYIERVRFLEAQNKKLQLEIDYLRQKWGTETNQVKEIYEVDIRKARHVIDDTARDCFAAEIRAKRAEEERLKLKEKYEYLLAGRNSDQVKIEYLQKQLLDNEADLNLLHRRLVDLEDEQKRFSTESNRLISDLQRLTRDLDQETLTRVQLEHQKQTLEEELHLLKEIHLQEVEELKQLNLIDTQLNPKNFFKNELSNAVKNIREEYEELNQQQRTELESWYQLKVTQVIQELQSRQAINRSENVREHEEIKKLRTIVSDSQQDILTIRQRNDKLENRIRELEELIGTERQKNFRTSDERDQEIKNLRIRLEDLGRDYDQLISTKSSLDSEIAIYRKLLEGEEKREGLKQIATNVEQQARGNFSTMNDNERTNNYSDSRTYQQTTSQQELENSETRKSSSLNEDGRIQSTAYEESIRLQDPLSEQTSDYDSSIEDPNERYDRFISSRNETK